MPGEFFEREADGYDQRIDLVADRQIVIFGEADVFGPGALVRPAWRRMMATGYGRFPPYAS